MQATEITPPAATEWCHLLLHDVVCSQLVPFRRCWGWWECKACFLFLITLILDLDIQTRPSKGPNTSSLWISRKSVQQFPRYFIHKQKKRKVTDSA